MARVILTEKQISLLQEIGQRQFVAQNFYLTGGTALAGFYLHHRYSEDLDFFSENEFDILQIDIVLREIKEKLGISAIDYQQSYNRNLFFLHFGRKVLKTEFTYFPFVRIEQGEKEYGVQIDSLLDIAVNKLFSIYQRTKARDYIDLYAIIQEKGYTISDLISKAKNKFDWHIDVLQLGTQFMKAREAEDYPRMVTEILPEEWQRFFVEEAKKFKRQIIE
ncbi:MAG: nucleotidyl transferase AbiEii/AbiGii toxin family protein [Candidatus Wildermuthbacteria bacterium]|nr:nucleotidyl transferase AbiEii/AbiGii toxin family protein [Candidatus Wildermuthbacteria bacterium]